MTSLDCNRSTGIQPRPLPGGASLGTRGLQLQELELVRVLSPQGLASRPSSRSPKHWAPMLRLPGARTQSASFQLIKHLSLTP